MGLTPVQAKDRHRSGRVTFEESGIVRKHGRKFRILRETEAINFVRDHTSIPLPSILETHIDQKEDPELNWFFMTKLPGYQLGDVWSSMTESAQRLTQIQLKTYLQELRAIDSREIIRIGSCSGGPAYDHRLDNQNVCGPFQSVSEFHDYLVAPVKNCPRPDWVAKYRNKLSDEFGIVFAHGDISWENILVDPETGNVTGLLDWEMAGYWPEWWEYRKALYGSRSQVWWYNFLKEIMQVYEHETETDMELEMF